MPNHFTPPNIPSKNPKKNPTHATQWKLENDVDDFVKAIFESLGLVKNVDYNEKKPTEYLEDALKGASKTIKKSGIGRPDFTCEKYKIHNAVIPVVIESKLKSDKLVKFDKDSGAISFSQNNVAQYALNGALHYARAIISSEKYKEAFAIAISGDSADKVAIAVYYVFGSSSLAYKDTGIHSLDFLQSQSTFEAFYQASTLTESDKHNLLAQGKALLSEHSKKLNKLMHNHNITAPQRVLYVSGMILSMQKTYDAELHALINGLSIDDLQGSQESNKSDGDLIYSQIQTFLQTKIKDSKKLALMLDSFREIKKDPDRNKIPKTYTHKAGEKKNPNDSIVAHLLQSPSSINKQIFAYIYEHIYSEIDGISGHLDIMGEMYSEFLKYALGDGKELGIVLTPPYITKMMAQILNISENDSVMDLATGSAGFLISSMELMIDSINAKYGKDTAEAKQRIIKLKKSQLLGVEYNAEMFTLATTNMILRGDGSSQIHKANTFETDSKDAQGKNIYDIFNATKILLNPPFTWEENGMPFIAFGLKNMKQGLGAIIIQDSAGSGKAIKSNKEILSHNTLLASIKMPVDLFQPMAGVQTSVYIFEAGIPHDYDKPVKFIDFRNDGFKRTARSLQEVDNPTTRYSDIIKIYKAGKNAKVDSALWNLDEIYIEDFITPSGADWNFDQHKKVDSKPTLQDFKKCVSEYLAWEVANVLKKDCL